MPEVSAAGRTLVRARAAGRCEYCGILESLGFVEHQIDHIIAVKHGGSSEPGNLALSCTICNRYKGSDIASIDPETAVVTTLYDPRNQAWDQHFRSSSGYITGLTPHGRATVQLLRFNGVDRVRERFER